MKKIFDSLMELLGAIDSILQSVSNITSIGADVAATTGNIKDVTVLLVFGCAALILLVIVIVALIFMLAVHIFNALPIFLVAKKFDRKTALLAWVPFMSRFALCDIPREMPLSVLWIKKGFKNRMVVYLFFSIIHLFVPIIIVVGLIVIAILSVAGLWALSPELVIALLLIGICLDLIFLRCKYLVLRDVLYCFYESKSLNFTLALIATIVDSWVIHIGLAQAVVLFALVKKEPLPVQQDLDFYDYHEV